VTQNGNLALEATMGSMSINERLSGKEMVGSRRWPRVEKAYPGDAQGVNHNKNKK